MLIGIPSEGKMLCSHFGHCKNFALYDTNTKSLRSVPGPEHVPGLLPKFLKEQGVELVIAGGMGGSAQDIFKSQGIQLIVGVEGSLDDVISSYEKGELVSSGAVCPK